ncbi:MAG TPA: NmrA/HSCARG family protein [Gemmatimonadales bacterium]|nr:NmrA/HSCARG family protein [Gemmatimonadales bacterium]
MPEKKIIAVVGATGAQGGGLVRAILSDPSGGFGVRALTRNPDSEKGQALRNAGAEVVAADLDNPATLRQAFAGAYGAFCLTNFWEHFSPEKELQQARNMAQAAKEAGVQHVIWSTLEDTRKWVPLESDQMPTLQGKYKVPHFDAKGEADGFFREAGVPTTFLLTAFYWENFIFFGAGPQRGPDGSLALVFPLDDKPLPSIAVEDIGKCAYAIFKRGKEFIGKTVAIAGQHLTGFEMARAMSQAVGQEIRYVNVPPEVYRSFGFPGADDLGNMFQFKRDFNEYFVGIRDLNFTRSLNPELQTFEEWLAVHKEQIPIPAEQPA